MNRIPGVVIGVVTDVNDPDNRGKVKVEFPWLADSNQSPWARIATLMSGKQRGSWFMPEVDDEVLVAFDHGDINHPYIVGFLWNGVDKPPNDGITTKVRRLKTVSGHLFEFDDSTGREKISLLFKGDFPGITIDQNAITVKFNDSSYIELTASELTIVNSTLVNINP